MRRHNYEIQILNCSYIARTFMGGITGYFRHKKSIADKPVIL